MKKILIKNIQQLLIQKKTEYKYLSPHIFKDNKFYYMIYCNRKSPKNFYGEINFAKSKNLKDWTKVINNRIKPKNNKIYKRSCEWIECCYYDVNGRFSY